VKEIGKGTDSHGRGSVTLIFPNRECKRPVLLNFPRVARRLLYLFVFFNFAVADVDNPMRAGGDIGFMRHQHDGVALLP